MRWRRSLGGWRPQPEQIAAPVACLALGSGVLGRLGVGGKAARLDEAAGAGLAVPAGFVVPDGTATPDLRRWCAATGTRSLAVRSAFVAEDRPHDSLAGWFTTELRVDPSGLEAAVAEVRASAELRPGAFRRDVLVMAMVPAVRAGVAFTEPGTYDDPVNVTTGTAERLVAGEEPGESLVLPRVERAPAGWQRRLQRLLQEVRRLFGDTGWDVEWADDGVTCWLLQVRPVTAPTRRDEAFTSANHAEILPPLPSHVMTSLIAGSGADLFAWYRRFDASLPANRRFIEVFGGRPFINLSLLEDLLRHLGLPTRLVADSIGGPPERDLPTNPGRLLRKSPVLVRMGMAQVSAVARSRRNEHRVATAGAEAARSFSKAVDQLHTAYVDLVTGMFPLSSAIGPPLAVLRRTGTLVEHASRHRTITTKLAVELDEVAASDDPEPRRRFLRRFGHRGVYESDIARPRYSDVPELLDVGHVAPQSPAGTAVGRTLRGVATSPVWWLARAPLAARERLRHEAMVGFADIRDSLVRLGTCAVADGQLPSIDHLWLLDVDELRRLDRGWRPGEAFWEQRLAERARLAALDPPDLVHRFDDPADWRHQTGPGHLLTGIPLTEGVVTGRAWVLREPSVELPEGFEPAGTVLVARSVDAGWIPTLSLVSAAVVEIGGDLSHGSILLRERGMPAITNVRGATRAMATGDTVEVRAGAGVVERTSSVEGTPT